MLNEEINGQQSGLDIGKLRLVSRRVGLLTELPGEDEKRLTIEELMEMVTEKYEAALGAQEPPRSVVNRSRTGKGEREQVSPEWENWKSDRGHVLKMATNWETIIYGNRRLLKCDINGRQVGPRSINLELSSLTHIEMAFNGSGVVAILERNGKHNPKIILSVRRPNKEDGEWMDFPFMVFEKTRVESGESLNVKFLLSSKTGEWQKLEVTGALGTFSALVHSLFWSDTMPIIDPIVLKANTTGN